jgi:TolB-like protein
VPGVAAAYLVTGAVIAGAANDILPNLGAPVWTVTLVIVLLLAGFPVAVILAWVFRVRLEESREPAPERIQSGEEQKSIAVLPFDNLSPDPNDAFFSDGLTEEVIADLSILRSLRVISRSSVMALKGTTKNLRTLAEQLGVQYVLEGSVRKAGDQLRITAQLIDAKKDHHLWAEKYDGVMDDIFSIQETVSRSIVDALRLTLNPREEERLSERPVSNVRAYELSMKARQYMYSFGKEEMEEAQGYLTEALEIAGENAYLVYLLAYLHYQYWNTGIRLDEEDLALARAYADQALALDPRSPDHLVIRGLLEVTGGNAIRGYRYFEAALERDPHHADALFWSPGISAFFGRDVEAKRRLEQLKRIDPLNPFGSVFLVWIELKQGRFKPALELAFRLRKTTPFEPHLEGVYALALAQTGRLQEAVPVITTVFGPRDDMIARGFRALACAFEGDREGVLAFVDAEFERWAEKDFQYAEWTAQAFAQVREIDRALDWLETSVERGNINYPFLNQRDSFLENVRGHPRFPALMQRVKGEWEAFEP